MTNEELLEELVTLGAMKDQRDVREPFSPE
jgi:hypothetical protein